MSKGLFFVLVFLAGCAAVYSLENLPLVWAPEREPKASAGAAPADFFKTKVKVAPFTDSRDKPKLIGENREGPRPQPVTTSDNVSAFVTEHFKALLVGAGLNVVDSGESAVIKGDIEQFFVSETSTYVGEVRLHRPVRDVQPVAYLRIRQAFGTPAPGPVRRTGPSSRPASRRPRRSCRRPPG